MRIVSWNVNGIRASIKKGFCEKAKSFQAQIIGLQETKANNEQVMEACHELSDYHRYANSAKKPGYSGVALFSQIEPKKVITSLEQDHFDSEGRVIIAFYDNFLLATVYFPNGAGKGD